MLFSVSVASGTYVVGKTSQQDAEPGELWYCTHVWNIMVLYIVCVCMRVYAYTCLVYAKCHITLL